LMQHVFVVGNVEVHFVGVSVAFVAHMLGDWRLPILAAI
jgi:hypothetical protein